MKKFDIHIAYGEFIAPTPFYVNENGQRRKYMRPNHKDFGKDVIANRIPVAIISTGDENIDKQRLEDAYIRQYGRIAEAGLLVDLADPSKLEYNDAKPVAILARAGVDMGNITEDLSTAE